MCLFFRKVFNSRSVLFFRLHKPDACVASHEIYLCRHSQIQLEKIRDAEHEVRWQHEEDVDECTSCKLPFSVTRRKVGERLT